MSEDNSKQFFSALRDDDLETLKNLLEAEPQLVDAQMPGDSSVLDHGVWENMKIVPVQSDEKRFGLALHYCAIWGRLEAAKLLIAHGANVNAYAYENNHEQTPPVVLAAWEGGMDLLRLLLENGADPNLRSSNGVTAHSTALRHKKMDRLALLAEYGTAA